MRVEIYGCPWEREYFHIYLRVRVVTAGLPIGPIVVLAKSLMAPPCDEKKNQPRYGSFPPPARERS